MAGPGPSRSPDIQSASKNIVLSPTLSKAECFDTLFLSGRRSPMKIAHSGSMSKLRGIAGYSRCSLRRNHSVATNSKAAVRASTHSIQGRNGRKAPRKANRLEAGDGSDSVGTNGTTMLVGDGVAGGGTGVLVGVGNGVAGGTGVSVGAGSGIGVGAAATIVSATGDGCTTPVTSASEGLVSAEGVGGAGGAAALAKVCEGLAFSAAGCFSTISLVVSVFSASLPSNDFTASLALGASGDC